MKAQRRTAKGRANGKSPLVRELTSKQLMRLIDSRSRALLGLSGEEFLRRYAEGRIEYSPVEAPVIVLADLLTTS